MTDHQVSDYVARKIKEWRKESGLTTEQFAERCGLTGNIIENIESGRRRNGERTRDVTVDELYAIAESMWLSPVHFLPLRLEQPEEVERQEMIQATIHDLALDFAELNETVEQIRAMNEKRAELNDRIAKSNWLIEQLRENG